MLLFLKAVDRHDTQTMALFVTPVLVDGHVKKDGTVVAPYVATRHKAPDKHPAVVAHSKLSNNIHVATKGGDVDKKMIEAWDDEFSAAYGKAASDTWRWLKDEALTLAGDRRSFSAVAADFLAFGADEAGFVGAMVAHFFPGLKAAGWPALGTRKAAEVMHQAAGVAFPSSLNKPTQVITVDDDGFTHYGEVVRPNRRDVPDYLLPQVEAIIEKVNRRAKRLGVDGFTLVKGEPFDRDVSVDKSGMGIHPPRWVRYVPVTIDGPTIKAPGGWKLAGRVDFEDGVTIVNSKPGTELPRRYRSIRPTCEHCKSDRQRNAVFVFNREGDEYMQVGRQCLKDYLGHDPAAALWAASEYGGVFDDIDRELDEDRASGGSRSQLVGLDDVMTAAAWAVREFGFTSRKAEEESGGTKLATSSDVSGALFGKEERGDYLKRVTQDDRDKAATVVAWIQSEWGGKEDTSDYEYNAVELTARRAVHIRRIGLLTSLVAAYDRAHEEKVAREKRVNAHVGTVGERREFDAVFSGLNQFDTAFGVMFVARFDTPDGLLVYKGGTIWWPIPLAIGTPIKFVGTIKEHADYKGTKQTLVSRCALPKDKPVKASKKAAKAAA